MSDNAAYVDTTRVAHREVPFAQLLDMLVAVAGLDPARIATILGAGTVTLGAYRYRWEGITTSEQEVTPMLEHFPKPDPTRPFDASRCLLARIRAGVETIDLPRDAASKRRLLQKQDFWEVLMGTVAGRALKYDTYSYRDGADLYVLDLSADDERWLREASPLLTVARTAEQVAGLPLDRLTLYVKR